MQEYGSRITRKKTIRAMREDEEIIPDVSTPLWIPAGLSGRKSSPGLFIIPDKESGELAITGTIKGELSPDSDGGWDVMKKRMGRLKQVQQEVANSINNLQQITTERINKSIEQNKRELENIRTRVGEVEGQLTQGLEEMRRR